MSKKLIGIIASFALVLSLVGANTASALTASDISMLQAAGIISAAQAASLSASIAAPAVSSGYSFAKDLTVGSRGADVTALQNMLGVSPATGYFGSLTKAALIKYQLSKGITPAAGYFGPKTRGVVNSTVTTTTTTTTTTTGVVVTGTDLSVSLAATSPLASAIVAGQSAANLAEFTFMNKSASPAVVTNVAFSRTGVSADTNLTNVYLYNGAVRLTDSASVSSGKITFNAASGIFTVPAGSSMTVSVKADIQAGISGQSVGVALTGVTASVPVSAVYPVSGAIMSVFNATDLATISLDLTAGLTGNISAGSLNQTIWSSNMAVSGRAVYLKSLALKVIGSIPSDALQNLKLFVAGVQIATAAAVDANGMVTFDLTSAPYKIDSSRMLEVRADVVSGSSRTFTVSLQNLSDLQIIDSNYNVGLSATLVDTQTAGTWTVNATTGGSVTVQQDTSLSAGDVITGASNVALGRYTFKAYGEDMKISYLWASTTLANGLQNVALYANGIQIGSTQTIATTSAAGAIGKRFSLGSSLVIGAGKTVTIEIRADIKNSDGTNIATSTIVYVSLAGESLNTQGSYAQQLTTVPAVAGILSVGMTVKSAGVTFGRSSSYGNQTGVPNSNNVKIGSYILQTTSAEPVRITNLTVALNGAGAGAITNVSNLRTSESTSDVKGSPTLSNNFSVDFTIAANASKIIDVYADLGTAAGSIASTSMTISGYGVNSNSTLSVATAYGQTITVNSGVLSVPTLKTGADYPVAQFVTAGSKSVLGYYNFISTNGDSIITEMTFNASGSAANIVSVEVDGHSAVLDSSGTTTISGLNKVISTVNTGVNVPIYVTYNSVGTNGGALANTTAGLRLKGLKYSSGNQSTATTTLSVDTVLMTLVGSKPSIALSNPTTVSIGAGGSDIEVAKVTVTADAAGPISLRGLPISMQATGAGASADGTLTVRINGSNGTLVSGAGATLGTVGTTTAATGTIVFSTPSEIQAGQSVSFSIMANSVTFTDSSSNVLDTIRTKLGPSSLFVWSDLNGSTTAPISGSLMLSTSYPTTQATVNNE